MVPDPGLLRKVVDAPKTTVLGELSLEYVGAVDLRLVWKLVDSVTLSVDVEFTLCDVVSAEPGRPWKVVVSPTKAVL